MPATGSPAAAIVHFEITLESFRRTAAATAGDDTVVIVDADTGAVVVDSRVPQRVGAPLGRPGDRRYASLVGRAGSAGVATVDGYRVAFQRLEETANNANHWYVVASDPDLAALVPRHDRLGAAGYGAGRAGAAGARRASPSAARGACCTTPRTPTR